ncbi:hypothetical protein HPB51_018437 [Rhipicephalus microplus]|uniref:Uncharacterized protein n=1 Tax=Rhipicephalus microplus TaxID=6941 RepID=A0A9J6EIY7_RHIMP|nr:hypothetical protein HPB51_018437 [Rhipicephalus microplus]
MSSDPIKPMFVFLRQSVGCDDALDVRSTICSLEKMLKRGIIAASNNSNVQNSVTFSSTQLLPIQQARRKSTPTAADLILNTAAMHLREHLLTDKPIFSNPDVASLAMIIAFIVRSASEHIACAECIAMLQVPNSSAPNLGLIKHLDRGGLYYPTQELVIILIGMLRFVDYVLSQQRSVKKPLHVCIKRLVQKLVNLPVLSCSNTDSDHR